MPAHTRMAPTPQAACPRPFHPAICYFPGSRSPLGWLLILRSMLSALLLLLLAALSLRTDRSACSSSSFSTSLMSLFALRSRDSCQGTREGCEEQRGGHQPSSRDLGCWALGLGCCRAASVLAEPLAQHGGCGGRGRGQSGGLLPTCSGRRQRKQPGAAPSCSAMVLPHFCHPWCSSPCCRAPLSGLPWAGASTEARGSHRTCPLVLVAFRSQGLHVAEGGGPGQPPAPHPAPVPSTCPLAAQV